MLNVAVVGLGRWGKRICESIAESDRLRVVRGMDIDRAAGLEFAKAHGLPVSDQYEDVLNDPDVEAVILVTPPSGHVEQALRALDAGKQLFCEKPLALTRAGAELIVNACRERGFVLGIDHERRFEPAWEELQRLVTSGTLGKVLHVEANHSHAWMGNLPEGHWRTMKSEGPSAGLTGMGIHFTDLFVALLGPIEEVFAYSVDRVLGFPNGDVASVQFRFPNGTTGTVATSAATPFYARIAVLGDRGWVEIREDASDGTQQAHFTLVTEQGGRRTEVFEPVDTVRLALEAWVDAAENGTPYRYRPEELVNNIAAFEAIALSIESGRPARVENPD